MADIAVLRRGETVPVGQAAYQIAEILLRGSKGASEWYLLRRDAPPLQLNDDDVWWPPRSIDGEWRHLPASSEWLQFDDPAGDDDILQGHEGLTQCLWAWVNQVASVADLDRGFGASLAVTEAAAADALAAAGSPGPVALQRANGDEWAPSMRESAFRMRHMQGMTTEQIAAAFGVRRQRIDQVIGKVSAHRTGDWPKAWHPSATLLRECGLALDPLHSLQLHAARGRSSAQ